MQNITKIVTPAKERGGSNFRSPREVLDVQLIAQKGIGSCLLIAVGLSGLHVAAPYQTDCSDVRGGNESL